MYSKIYYIDKDKLPKLGEPCMIVSNHQNCANDPLNLLLGLENESHPFVIARGNVFSWHPLITKFFLWLGMLPAFRLSYDGAESLSKNSETIRISGGKMLEGNRLIMYPEGTHQDKRWLGVFSYGYTRLAFQTAESDGFKHDIKIVPSANHYEDYFEVGTQMLIRFGEPISLEPYYELYKSKPRTAQREVSKLVRKQIEDMMLDIRDLEHYAELDWLRNSSLGVEYAVSKGLKADYLPDKLKADKELVSELEEAEISEDIYKEIADIIAEEKKLRIDEKDYIKPLSNWQLCASILGLICLLPLWLVSLFPNIIHYNIHRPFMRTDKMFTNSWRFIIPVVVGVPFWFIAVILVCGLVWGLWWQSALWMLIAFYPLSVFALRYWKLAKLTIRNIRMRLHGQKAKQLRDRREKVFEQLRKIISTDK